MAYFKKSLFVFGTVALSTAAVAGFFIRQKILSNWKIAEFNALLKQIENLKTEINDFEQDLEKNTQLQNLTEEKNQAIEKQIKELEESIKDSNSKILKLSDKKTSNKTAKGIVNISEQYQKFKTRIKGNKKYTELSNWNELFPIYEKILLNYIYEKRNILQQSKKHKNITQEAEKKKMDFNEEIKKNKDFLSKLKVEIDKLTKNIEDKKSKLMSLKKSREREREDS